MDFNYKGAWNDLAKPGFACLPQNFRDLYERVAHEGREQGPNLDCVWPEEGSEAPGSRPLRAVFRELAQNEPLLLATASRTIHAYGHWFYIGNNPYPGAYWRFSNYADQVLRERYDLPRESIPGTTTGIILIEGTLRYYYQDYNTWSWKEIGLCSTERVEWLRSRIQKNVSATTGLQRVDAWKSWEASAKVFRAHCGAELWDLAPYGIPNDD